MISLTNKCYRIYIACILFINMRYTFGMLLLQHPVQLFLNFVYSLFPHVGQKKQLQKMKIISKIIKNQQFLVSHTQS